MSTTIDNRVVEMRFDNAQFEKNASKSISTLERLKQALKFNKSDTSGFDRLEKSAKSLKLDSISDSVDKISGRFSNLGIVGVTALQRITNSAITAGERIVSALTIDPVKTGLEEYETKMGAIQVIRANDQSASMNQISDALNELNEYADKTIYNFAQMTSNVGKFVAQGLGVQEAANAVKGMANLAAASGASASDMARATYQMSQALGGVIRKIDVNSLRNANMWTTTLKNTLMDVARAEGVAIDKMIEEKGTLEETLEKGWLTGEMFTKAMNIYSGVYDEAQLRAMGFNEEQIKNFQNIAKVAEEAAVEVKTFTQLIDTFKESVQSGWTQSWEAIIGNFEEAKALWTAVSRVLETLVGGMADTRNAMLETWKALGGRDRMISAIADAFEHLLHIGGAIKEAFNNVFPPTTGKQLLEITKNVQEFIRKAKPTKDVLDAIYYATTGVLQVVKSAIYFVKELARALQPVTNAITKVAGVVVKLVGVLGYLTAALAIYLRDSGKITMAANAIAKVVQIILYVVGAAVNVIVEFIKAVSELPIVQEIFTSITNGVTKLYSVLSGKFAQAGDMFAGFFQSMRNLKKEDIAPYLNRIGQAFEFLWGMLKPIRKGLNDLLDSFGSKNDSFGAMADGANTLLDSLKEFLKGGNIIDSISKKFDSLKNAGDGLSAFEENFHGFVTRVLERLRQLDLGRAIVIAFGTAMTIQMLNLARAFSKLPTLMKDIHTTFKELKKTIRSFNQARDSVGDTIIKIAGAIAILAGSVFLLSRIDSGKLKSATLSLLALITVFGILAGAMIAVASVEKIADNFEKASRGVIELAGSVGILVAALKIMDTMHPMKIEKNIKFIGSLIRRMMGVALLFSILDPAAKSNALVMIGFALALYKTVEAVAKLASFPESQIQAAGDTIAQLMLLLTGLTVAVSKIKFGAGAGLMAIVTSLYLLEGALWVVAKFGVGADTIIQNIDKYIIIFGAVAGLLAMTQLAGANAMGAGVAALGIGVALVSMTGVLVVMAKLAAIDPNALLIGVLGLVGLTGGVYILMRAVSNTEKASIKAAAALIPMSLALVLMAGTVKILSGIGPTELAAGLAAVGILTLFAAGLMAVSEMSAKAKFAPIIGMVAAVVAISGSLALLSMADPQGLGAAAGALMLVLLSFAGAMASATTMVEKIKFSAIAGFITMIGVLVASSTALATLATLPAAGLIAAAGALAILMGTMALAGSFAKVGVGTAFALTVLSVAMVPLAYALQLLQGIQFEMIWDGIKGIALALGLLLAGGAIAGIPLVTTGLMALMAVMAGFALSALVFSEAFTAITNALIAFAQNGPIISASILSVFTSLGVGINFAITSIGTGIGNAIVSLFGTIKDGILNGIDSIIDWVKSKREGVKSAGESLISAIAEGIISGLPSGVQSAISVVGAVAGVFTGGGLIGTLFSAGADAVGGLAEGIFGSKDVAADAMAEVGVAAENGLRDQVGWHSNWDLTIEGGKFADGGLAEGILNNSSIPEAAAAVMGKLTGNGAINSILSVIGARSGEVDAAIAALMSRAKVQVGTSKVAKDVSADSMRDEKKDQRKRQKEQKKQEKANEDLAASFGNIGSGGGGGGGGGAAGAAKEVKKLFDVMADGGKVVQKFAENFGVAYQNVSNTHPLQMGKEAVQKLAEAIYAETTKAMDATTLASKTTEDKLAEMRDAFISFYDNVKGKISGAVDEFGKFSPASSKFAGFSDWNKALDRQKSGISSWEQELRLLAKRSKNFNLLKMVVEWGPEQIRDLRLLNSMTEEELTTLSKKMLEAGQSYNDAYADMIMASIAYTTSGMEDIYANTTEVVAEATEKTAEEINDTAEKSLGQFTAVTKDGVAVVSKAQSAIINGNNNTVESFKKVINITDQLKSKVTSIYSEVRDTVEAAISSNFNIFEKFDKETELTGDELLENMESRIHGTREWQSGISELIGKGLNEGLAKKLMEEGTASYDKVQAMLEWSESEIDKANSLFEQSLTIASEVADALGKDMAAVGVAAAEGFVSGFGSDATKGSIMQAARDAVNVIIGEFNDPNSGTAQAAGAAAEGFSTGMSNNQSVVDQSLLTVVNNAQAVWAAGAEKSMTYVADQAIDGFVNTITSSETRSRIQQAFGDVLGGTAIEATEDEFEINSPSRVFARIGEYCVRGLSNGIIDNSRLIENASESIGDTAIDSMKTVVGHIADIINGEVQVDPTIRPVVDLSNVEAGAAAIGSMFGGQSYSMSRGIGFQNPNGSINDLMNQMMANQMAMATSGAGSPINMYVYAAPGQSEEEIANIVEQKLMFRINRQGGVWK